METIVSVKNLSKEFDDIKAVDDLSFSVTKGQVYGFLGQNGAGKSTTIRMLLSLVEPGSGTIEIFGMELRKHRKEILQQVGAIIERPDLYKYLTAYENLRLFATMSGKKIGKQQLMDQLAMVGLEDRAHSKVRTYSQGMKQRLGIAVALVHDPQLIVLDEPTNGLDPQGIADVRHLILHLSRQMNKTVFVSSHLLNEIEQVADSMLIINKGRKLAEGSKEELLNPVLTQVELITDDNESTLHKLRSSPWRNYLLPDQSGHILLEMEKRSIPELNRTLVEKQVNVISLKPKHSLEDYFLSLTSH
jgi:ABC-2 type transport system ATP-binding protein